MVKIHILTSQAPWKRGFNDFYPLFKWKKDFTSDGVNLTFFYDHFGKTLFDADILIIDYRYYEQIKKGNHNPKGFQRSDYSFVIDIINEAKAKKVYTILFDSSDSAGTKNGDIIPHIDLILKKQLFKDRSHYRKEKDNVGMIWLPDEIRETKKRTPVNSSDIDKLKVGWNIGMSDFRYFPGFVHKYSPLGTAALFPQSYKNVKFKEPSANRKLLLSYRGGFRKSERYNYSRRLMIDALKNLNRKDVIVGGRVSKSEYNNEIRDSKVGVSPFGWGEICYRDFETIINGSLLVKPDMSHIETFPNLYIDKQTYLSVDWDYKNVAEVLEEIDQNYEEHIPIIKNSQQQFREYILSSTSFINHFKRVVNI